MVEDWKPTRLDHFDDDRIEQLANLLIDCVEGGASIGFLLPLSRERAVAFWRRMEGDIARGARRLLVAEDEQGICGTVQLILEVPENQRHRADVGKVLVHHRARRRGLGAALIRGAEAEALACGRTLLILVTLTGGDASRLYERLGWVHVGDVPGYARLPDGEPCVMSYYYRDLAPPKPPA
jgi:GNAT superfamily N-acetyltransferase